jgi:hypothetical protein
LLARPPRYQVGERRISSAACRQAARRSGPAEWVSSSPAVSCGPPRVSLTLRSTPESGERAGYDGAKRKRGSKLHLAVDTLGHLLALHVTPANAEDRGQVEQLAQAVQSETGGSPPVSKQLSRG